MPVYEYECPDCGHRFERLQPVTAQKVEVCPNCGGQARRLLQPVGIIFKGAGFYSTDHRSPPPAEKKGESGTKEKASAKE